MIQIPLGPFLAWALVFLRVSMVLTFFPILGDRYLPVRIRIMVCAALALVLTPMVPVSGADFPTSGMGIALLALTEGMLAMGLAFIGKVLFAVIQTSGQLIGQEIGYGVVNAIDPSSHQVTAVAEMQYLLAVMIFFAADLHHVVIEALAMSFTVLKPGAAVMSAGAVDLVVRLGGTMYALAVGFAMPVIVINFALNVALGMISRAVPQLNVFVESFPLRIVAGLSLMMLSLGFTVALWQEMFGEMGGMFEEYMRLLGAG